MKHLWKIVHWLSLITNLVFMLQLIRWRQELQKIVLRVDRLHGELNRGNALLLEIRQSVNDQYLQAIAESDQFAAFLEEFKDDGPEDIE